MGMSSTPPVPPLPPSFQNPTNNNNNNTNPANVFAQMKSGTFGNDNESSMPQDPSTYIQLGVFDSEIHPLIVFPDKYDALRPQPTGWGGFQGSSYVGYH